MCGIIALLISGRSEEQLREDALKLRTLLRHRGPDWSGLHSLQFSDQSRSILIHERLAIVGVGSGEQPLLSTDGSVALCVNGEIYNHKALATSMEQESPVTLLTDSDCEKIIPLYERYGAHKCVQTLDGMFAFVLTDVKANRIVIARDPIGIVSLYYGRTADGTLVVASELKVLEAIHCEWFEEFPPGHVLVSDEADCLPQRWYQPVWYDEKYLPTALPSLQKLRETLEAAVVKRLMADVPYGVLLSGGLDSSLVAAIASRHASKRVEDDEQTDAWFPRLHTFSIGLEGSPDLERAREVAEFLGSVHHEWKFTVQQGIDAVKDVIRHIETYDVTTIRASTPMYLLSRRIRAMGVKMVLSGEGADEVFGGYLYFHKAPSAEEFQKETVSKIKALHSYDCLRANKSTMAWGVEARVPFLDKEFLEVSMTFDPSFKMVNGPCLDDYPDDCRRKIEKYIIRKAFDDKENPYLPESILWRQKEQFSDGVGYNWIDSLKKLVESQVTDLQIKHAANRFPIGPPTTKEGYFYRQIYHELYPSPSAANAVPSGPSVACSTPAAIAWDEAFKLAATQDPSGRSVSGVHLEAYQH